MEYLQTLVSWLVLGSVVFAAPIVELNVVPSSRAPLTSAQDWVRALSKLKSVRVRSANVRSAKPDVKRSGNSVRITAVIGSDNQLLVPGKRFTLRQVSAIQDWIELQRSEQPATAPKDRFGLSTVQLQEVHESLKATIPSTTKHRIAIEVVNEIGAKFDYPMQLSGNAQVSLQGRKVTGELQGFSAGTALAMVMRAAELEFLPKVSPAGKIELVVLREGDVPEAWPVGWESKLKRQELVPKIFDYLEIEITETPVRAVLAAIEARIETPFFYDDVLLEVTKLDLDATKVSIPAGRTTYSRLIRQAVFKAKLKFELRVDERGKPFFWITPTIRRSLTNPG